MYCTPFSGPVCWPFCHCLAPKHCVLHITYCTLFPGPVTWLFGHCLTSKRCALHITYSALFSGPVHRPFGHCLTPKPCPLSYHILYPVFRTSLLASWPQPNTKTSSASYHILYPVFRTSLPASWLLPLPKQCVFYIMYSTLFSGPICWPFGHCLAPKCCALLITYVTLFWGPICLPFGHCLTSEHCALYHIVHFISPTVPSFQDQFACPLTTASHIHTYKNENQHSRGISVVSVVGPQ